MDRFELNWPGADASFYTDGWRCRIVWRQKNRRGGGGMGGTIDNNQQCVKRAAESLEGAPYLLSALKARGHDRLADQIETEAAKTPAVEPVPAREPVRTEQRERRKDAENRPAPKRVQSEKKTEAKTAEQKPEPIAAQKKPAMATKVEVEQAWLERLEGDASFAAAANKRAKDWIDLGAVADEVLLLKKPAAPAASRKAEWVLKRTWPEDAKRKPEYVVAAAFKGIAGYLVGAGVRAKDVERIVDALADTSHPELEAAAKAWGAAGSTH